MKRALRDFITTHVFGTHSFARHLLSTLGLSALIIAAATVSAAAQKKYDAGVTDTEIKVGNIMPYSGPASAYGIVGKTMSAYMRMINDNGGVNGRKINFISYDDAYSPPKTVEQARKLVESDEVFLIFAPLGTASNAAIQKYQRFRNIPQNARFVVGKYQFVQFRHFSVVFENQQGCHSSTRSAYQPYTFDTLVFY